MGLIYLPARRNPLRKPKGFEPVVQRWSVALPQRSRTCHVSFLGVQGPDAAALDATGFLGMLREAFARSDGPSAVDHARHRDEDGRLNHIVAAYWTDPEAAESWASADGFRSFWSDPARMRGTCGFFRECLAVPVERQETLYWADYRAALSASANVAFYPTPYCGYYGSMRDRLPIAAYDDLAPPRPELVPASPSSEGRRLRVTPPENLAVIRSATYWGACDDEQRDDFEARLRRPLEGGMDYIRGNAREVGCCSLRYQSTVDASGEPLPEAHALGIFLSLAHLENWAERHASHHGIFSAAMARYRKYGAANQLRTWHEVYVLPRGGQLFEYLNCSPRTGLLPWFAAHEA